MSRSCSYTKKFEFKKHLVALSPSDIRRCKEAASLAIEKSNSKYKLGCVIYSGHARVSHGVASTKSHPYQKQISKNPESCFLHAEISALVKDRTSDNNKKLYVMRVLKNGSYAPSFPCNNCLSAIMEAGNFKALYFYDEDGLLGVHL